MVFSTSLCFRRNYTPSPVLENLGDIQNTFLDISDLPKQDHEEVEKLICRLTSNDAVCNKKFPAEKCPVLGDFKAEIYQTLFKKKDSGQLI